MNEVKPGLRFDKVATRLLERLRASLGEGAPDGTCVLLTITAPIRLPSKTAAALEERIRALVARRASGRTQKATIHGNRVQIRVSRDGSGRAPTLIGFVHNPDTDPRLLLSMAEEWVEAVGAGHRKRAPKLVVRSRRSSSCLEVYRFIHSQLRMKTDSRKILIEFGDGRVGTLAG